MEHEQSNGEPSADQMVDEIPEYDEASLPDPMSKAPDELGRL